MLDHVPVQNLPELEQTGSIQMSLLTTDVKNLDVPFLDIGVQFHLCVFDVETTDCRYSKRKEYLK